MSVNTLTTLVVPHELFNGVLRVEAVSAKDLHGIGSSLVGNIASKRFGNRCMVRVAMSFVNHASRMVDGQARRFDATRSQSDMHCGIHYPMPMSASIKATAWCSQINLPIVLRCIEYFVASSKQRRANPTAPINSAFCFELKMHRQQRQDASHQRHPWQSTQICSRIIIQSSIP
jgi:hypothetical protein